jgi:hypothetical protein
VDELPTQQLMIMMTAWDRNNGSNDRNRNMILSIKYIQL